MNYAAAIAGIFAAVASLGLDSIAVREIVHRPEATDEILGTSFMLKFLGGIAASVLSLVAIYIVRPNDSLAIALVGIAGAATLFQALDAIEFWFAAHVRSKYVVYAKSGAFLLVAVGKVSLILLKAPLLAFACANFLEIALGCVGLLIAYQKAGRRLQAWKVALGRSKLLLRDSWPLILSGVVIMIYMRIDQVMLGQMVGDREVGVYSVAVRLAEAWYFIPLSLCASIFPGIIEAKKNGEAHFDLRIQKLYNLMALISYAVALPITFLSSFLVRILYGAEYLGAGPMLAILVWAGLFVSLGLARTSYLTAMNWTKLHFISVLLGSLINILLNLLLIPEYGGVGASIATCIAYFVATLGSCFFYPALYKTGRMLIQALIFPKIW